MNVKKRSHKEENPNIIKRKITASNYIALGITIVVTLTVVFGIRSWYISYQNYQLTIPILKDKLKEVNVNEIDDYLNDNPDTIIYIEVSDDENSRDVAKKLLDVVKKRNIADQVVYVNLLSTEDKDKFFKDFSTKYSPENKIEYYPALLLLSDGKVVDFVSKTKQQKLSIGDVDQLFDEYEVENN